MLKKIISHYRLKKAMIKEAHINGSHFDHAPLLTWEAPFRHKPEKGFIWLTLVALAMSGILYYSIVNGNWFFGIAMVIAAFAYGVDHFEETKTIEIKISDIGIKIGKKTIAYSNIKAFWILYHPPFIGRLYIRTHQKMLPDIIIELAGVDPALIRKYLTRHVIEWEGKEESFMDLTVRLLKL